MQETTNYKLKKYQGDEAVDLIAGYNASMDTIDTNLKSISTTASGAQSAASAAQTAADNAQSTANDARSTAESAYTGADVASQKISRLAGLTEDTTAVTDSTKLVTELSEMGSSYKTAKKLADYVVAKVPKPEAYVLPKATTTKLGGVMANTLASGANRAPLTVDSTGKAFVQMDTAPESGAGSDKIVASKKYVDDTATSVRGSIPTKTSQLTNDSNFVNRTTAESIANTAASSAVTAANVPTKTSQLTNDSGFQNSTQVSQAISNAVASMYKYKGSKTSYSALPSSGNVVGDVWNVTDTGMNYGWTGTAWDALGTSFELTAATDSKLGGVKAGARNASLGASKVVIDSTGHLYVEIGGSNKATAIASQQYVDNAKPTFSTADAFLTVAQLAKVRVNADGLLYLNPDDLVQEDTPL